MAVNFKKPSKKATIITAAVIIVLLIIAATGTVMFLRDRGTTEAAEIGQEQVSTQNENAGSQATEDQPSGEATVPEEQSTTEEAATQAEEGTQGTAETTTEGTTQTGTQGTTSTGTTTATTPSGATGTTTATEDIQESTITRTETIEIPERKISEDHDVWWEPMDVNAVLASASINPSDEDIVDVEKTGDETVIQGEAVNYTITVTNKTENKLEGIEVKDVLADELDSETVVFSEENTFEGNVYGNTIKWNVDIEVGQTVTLKFSVNVKTNVAPGTQIENSAIANGEESKDVVITEIEEAKVEISGTKIWEDANNQDGKRPTEITIYVDKKVGETETPEAYSQTISADEQGNWNYTFSLPKYENGEEVEYTVREEAVEGYETTYGENNTITNTHTPELYNEDGVLSGEKVWSDNNDQDGIRPDSVTIELYKTVGETTTKVTETTATAEKQGAAAGQEEELDPKLFFRVNKKYIVNFSFIEGYEDGTLLIRDTFMTVSRRKKKDFEKKYRDFDLYFR